VNLKSLNTYRKLFSHIFLSLLTVIYLLCPNASSPIELTYDDDNTSLTQKSSTDSLFYATVSVNGDTASQSISYVKRDQQILIDADLFCDLVGGQYYPIGQNFGLTVQYGKIISFAYVNFQQGFVALQMVDMLPPAEAVNNTVLAPLNFLADAIAGEVSFIEANQHLQITVLAPSEIGDIIPKAKTLADALSLQNYTIQQGGIDLVNAIHLYVAGYQADCNGNNANYPYLMTQTPPCPDEAAASSIPMFYMMRPDEAFVLIGRTPLPCTYYSYRSYLFSRYYEDEMPHRTKIYASLGDTQSRYNMSEGHVIPDSFNRFFMLISTADQNISDAIRSAALASGISENDIYMDVIPSDIVRLGLDEQADYFNFFHRAVLFNDPIDEDQYTTHPPLEFLRITPNVAAAPNYIPTPTLRQRGTGTTEFHLNDGLEQLKQQIMNQYSAAYDAIDLTSYQWLPEGYEAIETRMNVRGETRDALYLRTPFFEFQERDIIVVFGVNHAKTGKATYCNINCIGVPMLNGLGGVSNREFQGTARQFLTDPILADSFYVWKFARTQIDSQTFVIPPDVNNDYTGLDYGAIAGMLFRLYVEPPTKVGPAASEVIMDRAILFRPKENGLQEKQFWFDDSLRTYIVYEPELSPNPNGYPLVIGLHGTGATGYQFMGTASLVQKATDEQFIVACPNALHHHHSEYFNAGDGYEELTAGTDDLGFISAVIDRMIMNYPIDTTRIYAMGFSNGSMMSYRVAAELSFRIAAIGVSSGQMVYEYCDPEFPVPIIHFHGLSDWLVDYEGCGDSILVVPPVDTVIAKWRGINDCSPIPDTIYNENGILGKKWTSASGKADIELYTIEDQEHEWPRTSTLGISATDVIWDFLKLQSRNRVTSIDEDDVHSSPKNFILQQNYPNPFNPSTTIEFALPQSAFVTLKVYNLLGEEVATLVAEKRAAGVHRFNWDAKGLASGVYLYRLEAGDPSTISGQGFVQVKKLILMR